MIAAVPSGRSVTERPPLSSNVYISFVTTSDVSSGGAREQFRVLEGRRLDVAVAEQATEPVRLLVHPEHRVGAVGQQVLVPRGGSNSVTASPTRNGFVARSRPTVVSGPCPGSTGSSSGRVRNRREALLHRVGVAVREVGTPDRAREDEVAAEEQRVGPRSSSGRACGRGCARPRSRSRRTAARRRRRSCGGPSPRRAGSARRRARPGWSVNAIASASCTNTGSSSPAKTPPVPTWSRWACVARTATGACRRPRAGHARGRARTRGQPRRRRRCPRPDRSQQFVPYGLALKTSSHMRRTMLADGPSAAGRRADARRVEDERERVRRSGGRPACRHRTRRARPDTPRPRGPRANASTRAAATSGSAASVHDGRRPLRMSA